MSAAYLIRTVPSVIPVKNGMPAVGGYRYGGTDTDTLTADLDHWQIARDIEAHEGRPYMGYDTGFSPSRAIAPCGTEAAYARHRRRGEIIDEACREADTRASLARKMMRERRTT